MNYIKILLQLWASLTPEQKEDLKDGFTSLVDFIKTRLVERAEFTEEEMRELDAVLALDPTLIGGFAPPVSDPEPPVVVDPPPPAPDPDPVPPDPEPPVTGTAVYGILLNYNPMIEIERAKREGYKTGDSVFYLESWKMWMVLEGDKPLVGTPSTKLGRLP